MSRSSSSRILRLLFPALVCLLPACATLPRHWLDGDAAQKPEYSDALAWAALPEMRDSSDRLPVMGWIDPDREPAVDVFFIHPTSYYGKHGFKYWNAPLLDEACNDRTDGAAMKYQASLFNGVARIYAPRYRQAHLHAFFSRKKDQAARAIETAYEDVRAAFEYFLAHQSEGRPFIIASHSQGSVHAGRLLREYIDGMPLQDRLVVAYLAGYPILASDYQSLKPCRTPEETGCICSWRTVREGAHPKRYHFGNPDIIITNPVTWSAARTTSLQDENIGAVLRDFNRLHPRLVRTQLFDDLLWTNKPKFPWSFLFLRSNYHIADYNFFYADIRHNAMTRVRQYLVQHP